MNKRSYKKYTEVYAELVQRCEVGLTATSRILPGERELAQELKTSRMTLRKALEEAALNGFIRRENKHAEITFSKVNLRQCGKILFLTTGYHDKPLLGAMSRMWVELKSQTEKLDADFELFPISEFTEFAKFKEKCETANIILLTVLPSNNPHIGIDYLKSLEYQKTIIALSDPFLDTFNNYVALDNYAAGVLAAKALLLAGCRRPVFINSNICNLMFQKRYQGMTDTMKQAGIKLSGEPFQKRPAHYMEVRRSELLKGIQQGNDGAFIASDEGIDYITHDLFEQGLVPDHFKLITLHGSGEALSCQHPIACVNHATEGVVKVLVDHLKQLNRNPNTPSVRRLIKPELYLTQTLGDIDINQLASEKIFTTRAEKFLNK